MVEATQTPDTAMNLWYKAAQRAGFVRVGTHGPPSQEVARVTAEVRSSEYRRAVEVAGRLATDINMQAVAYAEEHETPNPRIPIRIQDTLKDRDWSEDHLSYLNGNEMRRLGAMYKWLNSMDYLPKEPEPKIDVRALRVGFTISSLLVHAAIHFNGIPYASKRRSLPPLPAVIGPQAVASIVTRFPHIEPEVMGTWLIQDWRYGPNIDKVIETNVIRFARREGNAEARDRLLIGVRRELRPHGL